MQAAGLSFGIEGAAHFPGYAASIFAELSDLLASFPVGKPGVRITGDFAIAKLLSAEGRFGSLASELSGHPGRAVRAVLFDKNDFANWTLGCHQDRTIALKQRRDATSQGSSPGLSNKASCMSVRHSG
jgi:hypothetical protein